MTDPIQTERSRARWIVYLLYACLFLDLAAVGSGFAQRGLLLRIAGGEDLPQAVLQANDARVAAIARLQLLVFILSGIAWLLWLYRAYANLRLVGTRQSRFTPGWAVGYWFVPLVNLVRPYQIVADLWRRSDTQNGEATVVPSGVPALLPLWWGVYLIDNIMGRVILSFSANAETIEAIRTSSDLSMVGDAIGFVSAILALRVVQGIDRRQQRFALSAGASAAGPGSEQPSA
jgi:uncharacterized protein DUF4328